MEPTIVEATSMVSDVKGDYHFAQRKHTGTWITTGALSLAQTLLGGGAARQTLLVLTGGWTFTVVSDMKGEFYFTFSESLDHSNVILAAGGGIFEPNVGPKQGAILCCHGPVEVRAWVKGAVTLF